MEFDCAKVVKGEDYVLPPMMKGAVNVDGAEYLAKLKAEAEANLKAEAEVEELCDEMSEIKM